MASKQVWCGVGLYASIGIELLTVLLLSSKFVIIGIGGATAAWISLWPDSQDACLPFFERHCKSQDKLCPQSLSVNAHICCHM